MKTTWKHEQRRASEAAGAGVLRSIGFTMVLLLAGAAGCGPADLPTAPPGPETLSQEIASPNGLSANGLSANGLSANGLSANGLSANGLSTSAFSSWFQKDPSLAKMVMRYVVRCAVPAGESRSHTNAQTGSTYTWSGGLGLAPGWASGLPPTLAEQQIITACLLAHVNRSKLSITISVLGRDAQGAIIPSTSWERQTYAIHEACFFGNLFTQEGLYFGVDTTREGDAKHVTRACAAQGSGEEEEEDTSSPSTSCEPLSFIGSCQQHCTSDPLAHSYQSCTYNGVTYQPLLTRMRKSDYDKLFPSSDGDGDGD